MNDLLAQFVWAAVAQIWRHQYVHTDRGWQWSAPLRRAALRELWRRDWGRP